MAYPIKQNNTTQPLRFLLIQASDHISGFLGQAANVVVTLLKTTGSFAAPAGAITEKGNGWYEVAANATDANTLGPLNLHVTCTGADPVDMQFVVVAYDPLSVTNLGLSALPTANPAAAGGLPTVGTGSGQLNPSAGGMSVIGYASGQDPATSVWEVALTAHNSGGSFGHFVQTLGGTGGSGTDPWATSLPGTYAAGTAGAILAGAVQAGASPGWFTPPAHWSAQIISAGGLTAIDTAQTFAVRVQDGITAPTIADALQGAHAGAFASEKTQSGSTTFQVFLPGSTTSPARTFTLDAAPTSGPFSRS